MYSFSLLKRTFKHKIQVCDNSQVNRRYDWEELHPWLQMYYDLLIRQSSLKSMTASLSMASSLYP